MKYSRDAESEADYTGAKLMYDSGYDPQAMVDFFNRLGEESGSSGGPQFLSDHPNPGNRAEAVAKAISNLPSRNFTRNTNEFASVKKDAAKAKTYTAQELAARQQQRGPQGQIDPNSGSIAPSGSFQTLDHSAFRMQYPSNWQVLGDQNSAITIAPQGGVGQNAIAYGVVVNAYQPQQPQSLEQSAADIVRGVQQSNPQVQPAGNPQRATVNGQAAVAVDMRGPSPLQNSNGQTVAERDKLVAVQRPDGSVLWLMFIAPEQDFGKLQSTYQQMLNSLQVR